MQTNIFHRIVIIGNNISGLISVYLKLIRPFGRTINRNQSYGFGGFLFSILNLYNYTTMYTTMRIKKAVQLRNYASQSH